MFSDSERWGFRFWLRSAVFVLLIATSQAKIWALFGTEVFQTPSKKGNGGREEAGEISTTIDFIENASSSPNHMRRSFNPSHNLKKSKTPIKTIASSDSLIDKFLGKPKF